MKAIDLFAGCGGLSLGLKKSGIDIEAAYENWDPALTIYKNNFSHNLYKFDLFDVEGAISHILPKNPDLISGGPPCQDFSSAGKRNEKGERADLTLSYAQIVIGVNPEWFIMENVDRIVKTKIFQEVKKLFVDANYGLTEVVLDASFCNVPQKRKRMFLIGKKFAKKDFLREIIISKLSSEGMTLRQYFGNSLKTNYYYRHPRSYSRRGIFSIDEPSPTIRGVNRPIPPDYKIHPGDAINDLSKVRSLTSNERAKIQTFPESYDWTGVTKSTLEQIIGNAVPVNLAELVGTTIVEFERSLQQKNDRSLFKNDSQRDYALSEIER